MDLLQLKYFKVVAEQEHHQISQGRADGITALPERYRCPAGRNGRAAF